MADRKWIALASLATMAIVVVGLSLFPDVLLGPRELSESSAMLHARTQCGHHREELALFIESAQLADEVSNARLSLRTNAFRKLCACRPSLAVLGTD